MIFELTHGEDSLAISEFSHSPEDAKRGNPYNTEFQLTVVSGPFRGVGACEYDIKEFIAFAEQINELYDFKRSRVELRDICYGSHVAFDMDKLGHITIAGEIFGFAMIHSMKFEFVADQTSLKPFANSLLQVYQFGTNKR